jgi:hypothetical protein
MHVILYPHSLTNPGDMYRVVELDKWIAYTNGTEGSYPVTGTYESYALAEEARDTLNEEKS